MHSFSVTEAWWKNRFFELNDGLCIELVIATKNVINVMIIIKLTIEKKNLTHVMHQRPGLDLCFHVFIQLNYKGVTKPII